MNLSPRYKKSLSAISLVALPLLVAFAPLSQVVIAQESATNLNLVAQADRKAEEDRILKSCRNDLNTQKNQEALRSCQQALDAFKKINDISGEWKVLYNLGFAYYSLLQYQKAIDFYQQSLTITRQIGNEKAQFSSLENLGLLYGTLQQYQKGIEYYQQALAIANRIRDYNAEGNLLNKLGRFHNIIGKYQKAIEYYQKALTITKQIGDRYIERTSLIGLRDLRRNKIPKIIAIEI